MASSRSPELKKRLGQHHLKQPEVCRPLIGFLRPSGASVLEVGPGGGVLTRLLLPDALSVIGWELDLEWAFALHHAEVNTDLQIVIGDALDVPWEHLRAGTLVTGNLPYGIATRLILDLLVSAVGVPRAAFLVQLEVAERLVASPGESGYGSLSVVVQAYSRTRLLGKVAPGSFYPPPKVESAFVGLDRVEPPLPIDQMAGFRDTVRAAFSHRRKTLRNSLGRAWGTAEAEVVLEAAGVSPADRAEQIDLDGFVRLHKMRSEH